MKALITLSAIAVLFDSCKKNTFICSCTYYNWPSPNTKTEYTVYDTERKAKKKCDSGNPKPTGGYISSTHHCELN